MHRLSSTQVGKHFDFPGESEMLSREHVGQVGLRASHRRRRVNIETSDQSEVFVTVKCANIIIVTNNTTRYDLT